jgi:uncharacterized membrane protein
MSADAIQNSQVADRIFFNTILQPHHSLSLFSFCRLMVASPCLILIVEFLLTIMGV